MANNRTGDNRMGNNSGLDFCCFGRNKVVYFDRTPSTLFWRKARENISKFFRELFD